MAPAKKTATTTRASETQPTGVTTAVARENAARASEADAKATDNSLNRKTDDAGRPLLDVELEKPITTDKNLEAAPKEDASEKKRDTKEPAPIRSVAQLRDRGITEGVAPTSAQVEEMRKIETEGLAELAKQVRLPDKGDTK
jgi:hypothetical protein